MSQNTSQSRLKGSLLTEVVENAGRPERTRTVDLYRLPDREAKSDRWAGRGVFGQRHEGAFCTN